MLSVTDVNERTAERLIVPNKPYYVHIRTRERVFSPDPIDCVRTDIAADRSRTAPQSPRLKLLTAQTIRVTLTIPSELPA